MRASYAIYQALGYLVADRVYIAPRAETADKTIPYITQQLISSVPVNTLDGYTGHDRCRVQIDVYHKTFHDCELLASRVKRAINNVVAGAPVIDSAMSSFDTDSNLYRISIDVFISEIIEGEFSHG